MVRKRIDFGLCLAVWASCAVLCACTDLDPRLKDDFHVVDEVCDAQSFHSEAASVDCMITGATSALEKDEPQSLPLFQRSAEQLREIARLKDQGKIGADQYAALFSDIAKAFSDARNEALLKGDFEVIARSAAIVATARSAGVSQPTGRNEIQHLNCMMAGYQLRCTSY